MRDIQLSTTAGHAGGLRDDPGSCVIGACCAVRSLIAPRTGVFGLRRTDGDHGGSHRLARRAGETSGCTHPARSWADPMRWDRQPPFLEPTQGGLWRYRFLPCPFRHRHAAIVHPYGLAPLTVEQFLAP